MTPTQSPRLLADQAIEIWQAGVDAVRADRLVADHVFIDDQSIDIGDISINRADGQRVLLVGAGKATASMARSLQRLFEPHLPVYGWVNAPEGTDELHDARQGRDRLTVLAARPAGVNEPTQAVIEGTQQILKLVREAPSKDLILAVLSGGGSALLAAPIEGISLEDKLAVTRCLSSSGADICDLNTVRKQLSLVKGGGLARACRGRRLVTLVLSDVLGDPLDVIASGPTVTNRTSVVDALGVLAKFDSKRELPTSIYEALERKRNHPELAMSWDTMTEEESVVVIGNNATAVDAAGIRAESLGYSHAMTAARTSEGSAESVGIQLAEMAVSMLRDRDAGLESPDCLITGGEPTVKLAHPNVRGRGGRNTHVVLAAMQRLREMRLDQETLDRIAILSGGTDGEDGPTDAAGAILCKRIWRNAAILQLHPADYLARSDSYTFFQMTDGLLITGPTHTNVCDVRVVLIR